MQQQELRQPAAHHNHQQQQTGHRKDTTTKFSLQPLQDNTLGLQLVQPNTQPELLQHQQQLPQEQQPHMPDHNMQPPGQGCSQIIRPPQQQPPHHREQHHTTAAALGVANPGNPCYPQLSGPPLPGCEPQRLADVAALYTLDSSPPSSPQLSNMLQLVCKIFNTNNALIALIGDRRIYTVDGTGMFAAGEFPWRQSLCGWTMAAEQNQVLMVGDTLMDARCVGAGGLRWLGFRS